MKNADLWDLMPRGSCKNRFSEEFIASIFRIKFRELRTTLSVSSNCTRRWNCRCKRQETRLSWGAFPLRTKGTRIVFALMIEAISFSETSVLTKATWRHHIPQDSILYCFVCLRYCSPYVITKYRSFSETTLHQNLNRQSTKYGQCTVTPNELITSASRLYF
jgi:hypothetical protein